MLKKILIVILILLVIVIVVGGVYIIDQTRMQNNKPVLFSTWGKDYVPPVGPQPEQKTEKEAINKVNTKMSIVLSLEDRITENSAWCGTLNLIWNDLKNEIVKQDIEFNPQTEIAENLNKGTFNTTHLSEDSYYKVYGTPTIELKKQIEKAIKEKFNETSDILDNFDWENTTPEDYFLYSMLKKNFEFPKEFTELEQGKFGNFENVKYFGIDSSTKEEIRQQVNVLYYNSKEDFAIKLLTKGNDEVIISRGRNEESFKDIYMKITQESETYKGNREFAKIDTLKIPNINFNLKEELKEIENRPFKFANGEDYQIEKALQTIKFELDKKGGKIKSEAGIMANTAVIMQEPETPREFLVDNTFTIFLIEREKTLPYFAAKISDISQVQEI